VETRTDAKVDVILDAFAEQEAGDMKINNEVSEETEATQRPETPLAFKRIQNVPRAVQVMRDRCQFRSIANMYRNFNKDPDGELSKEELNEGFHQLGFNLSHHEFNELWRFVDRDDSGGLSLAELLDAFTSEGPRGGIGAGGGEGMGDTLGTMTEYDRMVQTMTGSKDGYGDFFKEVSARELADFLKVRMEARSTLKVWFREVDFDDSGAIDKEELRQLIEKFSLRTSDADMDKLFNYLDGVGLKDDSKLAAQVSEGGHVRTGDGGLDLGEVCNRLEMATDEELDEALGCVKDEYQEKISFDDVKIKSEAMIQKVATLRHRLAMAPNTIEQLCKADSNRDGIIERSEFLMWASKGSSIYPDSHTADVAAALWDALDRRRKGTLDVRNMMAAIANGFDRPQSTFEMVGSASRSQLEKILSPEGKKSLSWLQEHPSGSEVSEPPRGRNLPFARREHNGTESPIVQDVTAPGYASEGDRFSTTMMKPAGRPRSALIREDPLPQTIDKERKAYYREGRRKTNAATRERMVKYTNKNQEHSEWMAKAAINGKTFQKFRYLKSIAKYENVTNRMEQKNINIHQQARILQEKLQKRGPANDPTCSPSPVAWMSDAVPENVAQRNKNVKDPSGLPSRNVWKWH